MTDINKQIIFSCFLMKSLTVQDSLVQEREKTTINVQRMTEFLYQKNMLKSLKQSFSGKRFLQSNFNDLNKGRAELLKSAYKMVPLLINNFQYGHVGNLIDSIYSSMQQMPGSIHIGMFITCIQLMGSQEQKEQFINPSKVYDVIGCYAQTELGHGSDVQSLETTATLIEQTGQLELNTPKITSAKYWPGDLGVMANYAMVFAQLIMKGKNFGVHPFIVRIRDENWNCLPGIEAGDIGPKMAFYAKENGYLILNKVRIPKTNILAKYLYITSEGTLERKGDPKVGYATMMFIRQYISTIYPKVYGQAISIATRYSMFRKQFKDQKGGQIRIIEYISQQEKLIPRIAEYYAMSINSIVIQKLCASNTNLVVEKTDFSLMGQTHACLCLGKALYSEIVYDGMQVCRKACGGHGYSHYSGIPNLIGQYAPNLTHQGENTVLYLQVARYVLKNYKSHMMQTGKLNDGANYIGSFEFFMDHKCSEKLLYPQNWTSEEVRKLLAQVVCCLVSKTTDKLMTKTDDLSDMEFMSYFAGCNLQQLAKAHGIYFTYTNFMEAILQERDERNKEVLQSLCKLFGITWFLQNTAPVLENDLVSKGHLQSLSEHVQQIFGSLRPNLIGLVDAFLIPEDRLRTHLAKGNPYENYLELSRKNEINANAPSESALLVAGKISEVLMKHGAPKL